MKPEVDMEATEITASEIHRRWYGPWTPEEEEARRQRNERFNRDFIEPLVEPLVEALCRILMRDLMKPGRELDKLVAEKVFGREVIERKLVGRKEYVYRVKDNCEHHGSEAFIIVPWYSTMINCAWDVVDRVHKSKFNFNSGSGFWDGKQADDSYSLDLQKTDEGWCAKFRDKNFNVQHAADGPTAPHAICLAALRAAGVPL